MSTISQVVISDLFHTFAEFYKYPTREFYEEIKSGKLDRFLAEAFKELDIQVVTNFKEHTPSYDDLKENYMECFSGRTQPFAPPIESVYKVWTNDPTAQVSIAKRKGYLMGDSALHMQYLLKEFQIDLPEGYEIIPDHLTILLEFCSFLQENTSLESVAQFIREHLNWLQPFKEELSKAHCSVFYVSVTEILSIILFNYLQKIES